MFAILSYGVAALAYTLLTTLLALSNRSADQGRWLLFAVGGTAVWGFCVAAIAWHSPDAGPVAAAPVDALRGFVWTLCLLKALPGAGWSSTRGILSISAAFLVVLAVVIPPLFGETEGALVVLGSSVIGCLAIEQLYRNASAEQRNVLRSFLWIIAAILGYDLFVFSDAVLLNQTNRELWAARGLFAAAAVPFFVLSAKRHPDWTKSLFISRHVVFYSATLTGVGMYLIAMATAGMLIRQGGGQWGAMVQLAFFVAALVVLALVLSSARLRIAGRMFIAKHFYRNRYEYRDEWLRLIRTLSMSDSELPLDQRSIKALADIVDSPGGQLWLKKTGGRVYEPFGAWGAPFPTEEYESGGALAQFLVDQGWIIDSAEYERDPERYGHVFRGSPSQLPRKSFVVPLFQQAELFGFCRLVRTDGRRALNYEDHDLLKTAGRQVAAFLAHDLATEQLAETRQFEAYSKLSAFVMHDLKNLLSQQTMLVENAKKYQHRPEFVADVVKTVDHGVQRMRRLLRQLERDAAVSREHRIEISGLVRETVETCAKSDKARPSFAAERSLWVHAQADRLASIVAHVIVNAQEATPLDGTIEVSVREQDGKALVEVRDNGEGMSAEFVRKRLFKPFATTKGSSGMGIGAYEAREVVRALGGDITVQSGVGTGTTVAITLPLADPGSQRRAETPLPNTCAASEN
jgi:putative PEP-CTERM system histidine kinase